jgi:nucleoside-triphosphatase THEP1
LEQFRKVISNKNVLLATLMIRSAKLIHNAQEKFDIQPENKDNLITKDILESISEEVLDKCEQMSQKKKHF